MDADGGGRLRPYMQEQPDWAPADGYQQDGYPSGGYQSPGQQGHGQHNAGQHAAGYPGDGYQTDGYQDGGYQDGGYQDEAYYDDGFDDDSFDSEPVAAGDVDASFVRPYQLTGGRTVPVDPTLALEAQVVADLAVLAQPGALRYEHREVVTLAKDPVSLAELGALLHLHLQVVRVLVADLAAAGHLRVLRPTRASATDPAMIERVIRGLSAIL